MNYNDHLLQVLEITTWDHFFSSGHFWEQSHWFFCANIKTIKQWTENHYNSIFKSSGKDTLTHIITDQESMIKIVFPTKLLLKTKQTKKKVAEFQFTLLMICYYKKDIRDMQVELIKVKWALNTKTDSERETRGVKCICMHNITKILRWSSEGTKQNHTGNGSTDTWWVQGQGNWLRFSD